MSGEENKAGKDKVNFSQAYKSLSEKLALLESNNKLSAKEIQRIACESVDLAKICLEKLDEDD